jgi:hypothetical protein
MSGAEKMLQEPLTVRIERPRPSEPMVVFEVERLPDGQAIVHDPYLLLPDGETVAVIAAVK